MGLFGGDKEDPGAQDALNAAVKARADALAAMTFPQLGDELTRAIWGPGGPGAESGWVDANDMWSAVGASVPDVTGADQPFCDQLDILAREGMQALEHAGLTCWFMTGRDYTNINWRLTRAGAAALQQGTIAAALGG